MMSRCCLLFLALVGWPAPCLTGEEEASPSGVALVGADGIGVGDVKRALPGYLGGASCDPATGDVLVILPRSEGARVERWSGDGEQVASAWLSSEVLRYPRAITSSGRHIYVVGSAGESGSVDIAVAKIDPGLDMSTLEVAVLDGGAHDIVSDVAVHGDCLVVAGSTRSSDVSDGEDGVREGGSYRFAALLMWVDLEDLRLRSVHVFGPPSGSARYEGLSADGDRLFVVGEVEEGGSWQREGLKRFGGLGREDILVCRYDGFEPGAVAVVGGAGSDDATCVRVIGDRVVVGGSCGRGWRAWASGPSLDHDGGVLEEGGVVMWLRPRDLMLDDAVALWGDFAARVVGVRPSAYGVGCAVLTHASALNGVVVQPELEGTDYVVLFDVSEAGSCRLVLKHAAPRSGVFAKLFDGCGDKLLSAGVLENSSGAPEWDQSVLVLIAR